jgi:hypothetical protein
VQNTASIGVERGVPPDRRIVVVRSRVNDGVAAVVPRQVRVVGRTVERELQHDHTRQLEPIAQRTHLVGDQAQVLGDERDCTKLGTQRAEQGVGGAGPPLARAGGRRSGRHLPVRLERTEVIDTHEVEPGQLRLHTREPPAKAAAPHGVPIVEWIAPELTLGIEVVGRNAGHALRLAARVEGKQLALPPNFDAVAIDVVRQVAEQKHALLVGVGLERSPLELEQVLVEQQRTKLLAVSGQ